MLKNVLICLFFFKLKKDNNKNSMSWNESKSRVVKMGQRVSGEFAIYSQALWTAPLLGPETLSLLGHTPLCSSWKIYDCLCLAWYLNKTNDKYCSYAIKVGWTNTRTKHLNVLKRFHKPYITENLLHTVCLCMCILGSVVNLDHLNENWCDENLGRVSEKPETWT